MPRPLWWSYGGAAFSYERGIPVTPPLPTTADLGPLPLPRDSRQPPEPLAARRLRNHIRNPRARLGIRGTAGYEPLSTSFSFLQLSSLDLSDTKVYEPQIRALLGSSSHFSEVVLFLNFEPPLNRQRLRFSARNATFASFSRGDASGTSSLLLYSRYRS